MTLDDLKQRLLYALWRTDRKNDLSKKPKAYIKKILERRTQRFFERIDSKKCLLAQGQRSGKACEELHNLPSGGDASEHQLDLAKVVLLLDPRERAIALSERTGCKLNEISESLKLSTRTVFRMKRKMQERLRKTSLVELLDIEPRSQIDQAMALWRKSSQEKRNDLCAARVATNGQCCTGAVEG